MPLDVTLVPPIAWLAGLGIAAGLWLLARGLGGYRRATRIADTGTSSVASMAAGEVRVAGIIEPAEVTLISPLQSERCVYYRSTIDTGDHGVDLRADDEEERAVGFTVRDATGTLAFEQAVLSDVTRARAAYSPTRPIPDQAALSDETSAAVRSLFAVVEHYPDLRSRQNVLDLQHEIERLESMIADRRELYNDQVYRFNTRISTLPTLILAWAFGWTPRAFFAAEVDETTRTAIHLASDQ